jgi:hypothetical protein
MTSYHASNEFGIFHFVMEQPDITLQVLILTVIIIAIGAWIITRKTTPHTP